MDNDPSTILHNAEADGYSMLGHLRPQDRYLDNLLRRLDGSKGGWVTVVRLQSDGSESVTGVGGYNRTCWVYGVDDDGRDVTLRRPAHNLYVAELCHPDSVRDLQDRHNVSGSLW